MAASEGAKGAEKKEKQGKIVRRTYIGGQAVIEGVMMKGRASLATAVRTESGEITVEAKRIKDASARNVLLRLPFVRGVVNLVTQLFMGVGVLMRSAEVFGDYAEPTKFDKWVAEKFRLNPMHILTTVSLVLGGGHSIGVPLAVAAKRSMIAPSAAMTIHPVRINGVVIGVPQTYNYFSRIQERIVSFVTEHSHISREDYVSYMSKTDELANDVGSVIYGREAVESGLIDQLGTLSDALDYLHRKIDEQRKLIAGA